MLLYGWTNQNALADMFISTPTRLHWEAFSHAEINARGLINHISTTVYCQVLIYTAYWGVVVITKTLKLQNGSKT